MARERDVLTSGYLPVAQSTYSNASLDYGRIASFSVNLNLPGLVNDDQVDTVGAPFLLWSVCDEA